MGTNKGKFFNTLLRKLSLENLAKKSNSYGKVTNITSENRVSLFIE